VVGRRVARLTLDNLPELPGGCAGCLFWEKEPVLREQLHGRELEEKAAWVSELLREWGSCGRVAYVDDVVVGHVLYAPAAYVPGAASFATAPASADAAVLTTAYVVPEHRGGGIGRMLVQSMAKDLLHRPGIKAVEAFGDTRGACGGHTVPADFLLAVGFRTQRAHARYPRMRMDLRTTVPWRSGLESALDRVLGGLGAKAPRPAGQRQTRGHASGRPVSRREEWSSAPPPGSR
jgi:GNAT superfamily N-acetyltransferase